MLFALETSLSELRLWFFHRKDWDTNSARAHSQSHTQLMARPVSRWKHTHTHIPWTHTWSHAHWHTHPGTHTHNWTHTWTSPHTHTYTHTPTHTLTQTYNFYFLFLFSKFWTWRGINPPRLLPLLLLPLPLLLPRLPPSRSSISGPAAKYGEAVKASEKKEKETDALFVKPSRTKFFDSWEKNEVAIFLQLGFFLLLLVFVLGTCYCFTIAKRLLWTSLFLAALLTIS